MRTLFLALGRVYVSSRLFPLFANRFLSTSRPDYAAYLQRLGLPASETDPITILDRTAGLRATDNFEVFTKPEPDAAGNYAVSFFVRGMSHLDEAASAAATALTAGDTLTLVPETDNVFDPNSVILANSQATKLGRLPRYLCKDVRLFLQRCSDQITVTVSQLNPPPAPMQHRLLCTILAPWPESWQPFAEEELAGLVELAA